MFKLRFPALILLFLAASCKVYHPVEIQWDAYHIEEAKIHRNADTSITNIITPYKLALDSQMNVVIGKNLQALKAKKPEGGLGDFFADLIREEAEATLGQKIDMAFFNSGGLRLPEIPAGDIKVTTIYELMPFDNELVALHIKGAQLYDILSFIAKRGGDPVSGVRFNIKENAPVNITVNGLALDSSATYFIVTNDYLANGGDNMNLLKNIPQQIPGVKLRDMLLQYFKTHAEPVNKTTDGRIQIQE
jgi:2',3'-cyclic-nucleotide 2'-phosphodiesterase (5'-nucleotidase family)